MSIKDEAHPNSLKTNENKTVLILDSYYNNTNLNLWKNKFIWKRALYWSVRKKKTTDNSEGNPVLFLLSEL